MDDPHESFNSAQAFYERGELLRAQQRHGDAAAMFQRALQADANHAPSYAMLALCWLREEGKSVEAIDAARRGVALSPDSAFLQSILALAIASSAKEGQDSVLREAREVASHAVQLDPDSDLAHTVEAQIFLRLRKFADAEQSARRALALDTENGGAAEVLSIALLQQRKDSDNADLVRYQLENRPDDDSSHTSAGWLALRTGRHKEANQHFLEALRLNPMNEGARLGLVESFRARSFVYRSYLCFCHMMNRFSGGTQMGIMLGGFLVYRMLGSWLKTASPFWGRVLVAVWLTLVLWSHLARGFGSFFMLFDGFARNALRPRERGEAIAVGGCTVGALVCLGLALSGSFPYMGYAALALFFSAITSAAAFMNDHYVGKYVYASAAVATGLGALVTVVDILMPVQAISGSDAFTVTVYIGVAITWMRGFRVLYA